MFDCHLKRHFKVTNSSSLGLGLGLTQLGLVCMDINVYVRLGTMVIHWAGYNSPSLSELADEQKYKTLPPTIINLKEGLCWLISLLMSIQRDMLNLLRFTYYILFGGIYCVPRGSLIILILLVPGNHRSI